jgi:hypothetical protein
VHLAWAQTRLGRSRDRNLVPLKRSFLAAGAGVGVLALVLAFLVSAGSHARAASTTTFGAVIATLNHTDSAVTTAQSLSGIAATSLEVVDISPIIVPPGPPGHPPSPCFTGVEGGSTCRIQAFEQAVGRNGSALVALRTALSQVPVTSCFPTQDSGTQCTSVALSEYLSAQQASLDQVVALQVHSDTISLWVYHPPNPCVQSPLEFCPS